MCPDCSNPLAQYAPPVESEVVTVGALQRILRDVSDQHRADLHINRQIMMDVLREVRSMRPPPGPCVANTGCCVHGDGDRSTPTSHSRVRQDCANAFSHPHSVESPRRAKRLGSRETHVSQCDSVVSHPHWLEPPGRHSALDTHETPRRQITLDTHAGQVSHGLNLSRNGTHNWEAPQRQVSEAVDVVGGHESQFFMARALGFLSPEGVDMRDTFTRPSPNAFHQAFTSIFPGSPNGAQRQRSVGRDIVIGKVGRDFLRRGAMFDKVSGCLVTINAICVGIHAHRRALRPSECERYWEAIFMTFNAIFVLELALRALVQRQAFLMGVDWRWDWLDLIIVVCGVIEDIVKLTTGVDVCSMDMENGVEVLNGITALRVVRTVRLLRIMKIIRVMPMFRELRIMVDSTLHCIAPLAWACVLLGIIQWAFSVYFLHLVTDYTAAAVGRDGLGVIADDAKPFKQARKYFGSQWTSMMTLFESITGGINWNEVTDALYAVTGSYYPVGIYAAFIALTTFAVLNVITGIFVENATKNAMKDRDIIVQDRLSRRDQFKEDALRVFHEANADGSGELTVDEFMEHLEDPSVQAFLENLELDVTGAQRMFRLIDLNGDGKVSAQEFVTGCMCLKGAAKTMDVAALLREVHRLSRSVRQSMATVHCRLDAMAVEAHTSRTHNIEMHIGERGHSVDGV